MKKVWLWVLLCFCLPLSACTETPAEVPKQDSTVASIDASAVFAQYQSMLTALEEELIDVKVELYVQSSKREEAERELNALKEELAKEKEEKTTEAPEYLYEIKDGKASVLAYRGKSVCAVIPATLEGCPVTEICDGAFENASVTEITVPDGVESVGWFAFSGCVSLQWVALPASVTSIGYGAFQNCAARLEICCPVGSYAETYAKSYGLNVKAP